MSLQICYGWFETLENRISKHWKYNQNVSVYILQHVMLYVCECSIRLRGNLECNKSYFQQMNVIIDPNVKHLLVLYLWEIGAENIVGFCFK